VKLEPFCPPAWLKNPHLQSVLPSLPPRRSATAKRTQALRANSQILLLECGAQVRLQGFLSKPANATDHKSAAIVVLLHGWEGCADSHYVSSLAHSLHLRHFTVIRLNLRDHGATHHLNREIFHSCRLSDLQGALENIQQRFAGRALILIGFSLGGNFMLRAAAQATDKRLTLAEVIAISPVLDPSQTLIAMEQGCAVYRRYFMRRWSRSLRLKQTAWPDEYDFKNILHNATLRDLTAQLVQRYTDFATLPEYLNGYALTGKVLASLHIPTQVLLAADDPLIPVKAVQDLASPPALRVNLLPHGGHCGFLDDLQRPSWAERQIVTHLTERYS
jgi:uncharacterized protein